MENEGVPPQEGHQLRSLYDLPLKHLPPMTDGMIIPITLWPPRSYRIKPSPHPPPPHPTVEGQAFPISVQREGTACFSVKMFVDGVSACVGTLSHQKQSAVASFRYFGSCCSCSSAIGHGWMTSSYQLA